MSRRPAISPLHKKLSELEAELVEAFRLPPYHATDQKISRRLQKRVDYINNLLSAEMASTPENNDQLREITEKVKGLEAAFRCWAQYRAYAHNMFHEDTQLSICSDCMEDDDDDSNGSGSPLLAEGGGNKGGESGTRSWGGFGKLCGAFVSGAVVGAVCCASITDFALLASFYLLPYQHIYYIPPT